MYQTSRDPVTVFLLVLWWIVPRYATLIDKDVAVGHILASVPTFRFLLSS